MLIQNRKVRGFNQRSMLLYVYMLQWKDSTDDLFWVFLLCQVHVLEVLVHWSGHFIYTFECNISI